MSKSMHDEHGAIQPDQQKDPYKAKSFSETNSAFFTTKKTPYCNLLILGDYEPAAFSKKKALLETSEEKKLITSSGKNNTVLVGEKHGVTLFISDFSYYEKNVAFPAYSGATMIVIIPNSAEDLRVCFNSIYNRPHKPAKDSKVVYINLFDSDSDAYKSIESAAKALEFSANQLVLEPQTFDTLVNITLEHTKEVFARLTQPKKLVESDSTSQQSSTATGSSAIL